MLEVLISVISIYLFILLGFIAKKHLKEKIDEKTLVLVSLYYLQPILTFWGLTRKEIDTALLLSFFLAIALVGNTGNLGIPLGIALFGQESVGLY